MTWWEKISTTTKTLAFIVVASTIVSMSTSLTTKDVQVLTKQLGNKTTKHLQGLTVGLRLRKVQYSHTMLPVLLYFADFFCLIINKIS